MRESLANPNIRAPLGTEKRDRRQILTVVLARPILIIAEPIVACTDLFLALEYAVFFLYFEAYPLIFKGWFEILAGFVYQNHEDFYANRYTVQGIYGFSNGYAALAFLPSE